MAPRFFFPALFAFAAIAGAQEAAPSPADPKTQPGHSMHGEVFNEGPRQAARLIPGTGAIHFPVTAKHEDAQRFFEQGVGQLHGFWYWEAERSFRQAAALDPDCAMAFWGMAMANFNNSKRAGEFIRKAAALKEKVSRREQLWISSLEKYLQAKGDENARRDALVKALEELSYEFPDEVEAKAFLVFHIWDNKNHGLAIPSRQAVDALAQQVLAVNPRHPGAHHYLIHLWNYGNADKRALPSAALCGQSAPGIAHMWHMPGHTFSQLKRYADAAWQQEASARVDHAYLMESRVLPDQIHNFAHNNEWLTRSLASVGRVHDSVDLAKNMIELPRLGSKKGQSYRFGRDRLLDTLVKFELWDELVALGNSAYLDPFDDPLDEVRRRRALGLAWLHKRDVFECEAQTAALRTMRENVRATRLKAADDAETKAKKEKKSDDQIARAMTDALRSFNYRLDQMENALAELDAVRALQNGAIDQARARLEAASDIPAERRARIYYALGDAEKALQLARDAAKPDAQQLQPQANLADLLWRAGKKDDAIATFEKLRPLSAQMDLDVPVFARLAPIASELKLAEDWRALPTTPSDIGQRPELNSLGPFRWQPPPALDWALPDERGNIVSLRDYAGRAVLIVFYLGSGCSHCIEQLNIFSPLTADYATAGISMVAVSSDSESGLKETFAKAKEGSAFTFPIVADPEMKAFKAYQAFDDFERAPLHGIFLVDRRGLLRWHDISHEPFRDATWLLGEAKRLLKIDPEPHGAATRVTSTR